MANTETNRCDSGPIKYKEMHLDLACRASFTDLCARSGTDAGIGNRD